MPVFKFPMLDNSNNHMSNAYSNDGKPDMTCFDCLLEGEIKTFQADPSGYGVFSQSLNRLFSTGILYRFNLCTNGQKAWLLIFFLTMATAIHSKQQRTTCLWNPLFRLYEYLDIYRYIYIRLSYLGNPYCMVLSDTIAMTKVCEKLFYSSSEEPSSSSIYFINILYHYQYFGTANSTMR
jgi:hypothetical protein